MRRGDVWWANVPGAGRRPVLVVSRNEAVPLLRRITCVPLTTTVRSTPAELAFDEDDGLPRPCVANFDDLRPIDKRLLETRIAGIAPHREPEICEAIGAALGC